MPPSLTSPPGRTEQLMARVNRLLQWRAWRPRRGAERPLLLLALVVFVGAAVVAWRQFPTEAGDVRWGLLLVSALVGAPAAMLLNGLEYRGAAAILDHRVGLVAALRVTVLGSAANLLPLPGSTLVRVQAMSRLGSSYPHAVTAAAAAGATWIGVTVTVAGLAQLVAHRPLLGLVWSVAGAAVLGLALLLVKARAPRGRAVRLAAALVTVEVGFVSVTAARLFLTLRGLGFEVGLADAAGLTVAGAVATAAGFFPAGLGLRELLAAGISPLVGLPAVAGLAGSVVDRLARFTVLSVTAALLLWRSKAPGDESTEPVEPTGRLPASGGGEPPVKVVFNVGKGRSGSTLLDLALGQVDGFFAVGELVRFWELLPVPGYLCGCGQPLAECAVWCEVRRRAFPEGEPDPGEMVRLRRTVTRWRSLPRLLATRPGRLRWEPLRRWGDVMGRLYRAVAETTGARVVVESWATPANPGALGLVPGVEPYVVHRVRDPRAVAYSWQRPKTHRDRPGGKEMARFGPAYTAVSWVARNLAAELVRRRAGPGRGLLVTYDEFVSRPAEVLAAVAAITGEAPETLPVGDDRILHLGPTHTVAGNPARLGTGAVPLVFDAEWEQRLARRHRLVVTALTAPLLHRYGYTLRAGRPAPGGWSDPGGRPADPGGRPPTPGGPSAGTSSP